MNSAEIIVVKLLSGLGFACREDVLGKLLWFFSGKKAVFFSSCIVSGHIVTFRNRHVPV